ncbi:MAG TPA: ATP-binding protein [Thermoanaerobaculia bacterium]|nr:ATP-binding protein [Thermoanaerobaculia bacterium]
MNRVRSLAMLLLALGGATLLFWIVLHQMSGLWLDVALRPEVRQVLERSLDDQKKLRTLDATNRDAYRKRFEETRKLLNRLDVLRMNREEMLRRFEVMLVAIFGVVAAIAAAYVWSRAQRARARERQEYLDRVAVLQETARRQAHEIKGPLTAARLELEHLGDLVRSGASEAELTAAQESMAEELGRLGRFTGELASLAAIGTPVLRRVSLRAMIEEFCATFANAWPNVALRCSGENAEVCADRDMVRQVFVNLCTNSARAISGNGAVTFNVVRNGVEVSDTGGGIPESLRARIFDPYVTSRRIGDGMGLGLAISRKIMLDHGGDLQLVATSPAGTTFRLRFGDAACS